jgi:hypothetical protein
MVGIDFRFPKNALAQGQISGHPGQASAQSEYTGIAARAQRPRDQKLCGQEA